MTAAGRAYQTGLTPLLDALASLTAQVAAQAGARTLTIGVGPTFATRWLIPRLALANSEAAAHSFDVDELNVHVPMPGDSDSLALFIAPTPGTYTFYCAPHYDKATGSGMRGTLIVEP